jgi:acyl-CoA thioester hydrolase
LPSQNTPDSTGSGDLSKQGPRDWLCQTAGAAAHSGGSAVHAVTSVGATFRWPVRVYWEDTDAGGIVFYANYLKFFERSRTEWLRSMGIEQQRLRESTGGMFVVIETSTHHHRPARLDDELIVTATLLEMGRASLIIGQQALLKSEQERTASAGENALSNATLLCEGRIRIGWVDAASMRPARIPDSIVSRLRTPT